MSKIYHYLLFLLLFLLPFSGHAAERESLHSRLGTAVTPSHFPPSTPAEFSQAFDLAARIGSHGVFIMEWKNDIPAAAIQKILSEARQRGLQTHLYLSPIALEGGRKSPSLPDSVKGKSFTDENVRKAYKRKILEYAALKPAFLGLATEANFLAQNPREYRAFITLTRETYALVKKHFPDQMMTISFQWDVMIIKKLFGPLHDFGNSLDIYSFTSYPSLAGTVSSLPQEYYSSVRKLLPEKRLGFSEIGWLANDALSEKAQAEFFSAMPGLMRDAKPEFIAIALLHDVKFFTGELGDLNSAGIRRYDGSAKPAWNVILGLQ